MAFSPSEYLDSLCWKNDFDMRNGRCGIGSFVPHTAVLFRWSMVMGLKGDPPQYLLSDQMRGVCCLHLERAIGGPEVDAIGDASAAALIYHLGRLWAGNVELEVGIFLPVTEK